MNSFNIGDKVVLVGTTKPVMIVEGHTSHTSGIGKIDFDLLVCFWEDSKGPNRRNFRPSELVPFIES